MQHVYGHSGNLGNECADHAAALGTYGLISSHNVTSRWIQQNFDASECFVGCHSISETLERLQHIRTNTATSHQDRVQHWHLSSCSLCSVHSLRVLLSYISLAPSLLFLPSLVHWFSQQVMVPISSSASTISSIDDSSEHNMWNPLLELLFLERVNDIFDSYIVDLDLAQIALSCHFAHNLLCSKEEVLVSAQ